MIKWLIKAIFSNKFKTASSDEQVGASRHLLLVREEFAESNIFRIRELEKSFIETCLPRAQNAEFVFDKEER